MNNFRHLYLLSCVSAFSLLLPHVVSAAEQPDAGRTMQELRPAPSLPPSSPTVSIQAPAIDERTPGGPQVALRSIDIGGNTAFTDEELLSLLGDAAGQSYDLAGLKGLADRITAYYHENDYPFARAFVPAQSMKDGALRIEIVEGRYGAVTIGADNSPRAASALKFTRPLEQNSIIEGRELERISLILDDQPGYQFTPIVRPGQQAGTGDLVLNMKREERFGGQVGIDNHGNRYTGRLRGKADLYANSPFLFGDQVSLSAIYTEEDMWFGSAAYSLPVGHSGLRGNIGYSHTYYELGKEFSDLEAHGTADIATAGLSYPLIRSQEANLSAAVNYQHKWLSDEQDSTGDVDKKHSDVLPVTLAFDRKDGFLGGGITYGAASWTHGVLGLDNDLKAADDTTAKSEGHFDKFNLDVARLQATPVENLVVFARAAGQLAADNLDSSEDFGLGGPGGVRAYPTGEGYGDEGVLAQAEIRYTIDKVSPYVFYDYGHVKINHDPWDDSDNTRTIAGAGVGVRFSYRNFTADGSLAWRTQGGDPESDDKDYVPQIWVSVSYRF